MTGTVSAWRMTSSATAWLTIETAAASRGSNRSTTMPRPKRPAIDMKVMTETASPALLRPTFGSSSAIWCTMKPIWATKASAKGSEIVQNAKLRISFARDMSAVAGGG